jgi:putative flippase GtrA
MLLVNKKYLRILANNFINDRRFLKFVFVGIVNTVFGYSIYALLLMLGVRYTLAVLFSTIIGSLFNFKTIGKLVFKNSENKLILKFLLIYAVVYIISISVIKVCALLDFNLYLGGIIALIFTVPTSFLLNREFVFRGKYEIN